MKKLLILFLSCLCILVLAQSCSLGSTLKPTYISYADKQKYLPLEIKKALKETNLYSDGMYKLLLGTAATESDFGKLNKQAGGPALGIFQMEPNTAKDIWTDYLAYHPVLRSKVTKTLWKNVDLKTQLRYNIKYQTAIAVVHYKRAEERKNIKIEDNLSKWSASHYYKTLWNTHQGKGSTVRYFRKYVEYVEK